jgi:ABC-type multidrug transport system fused ATPase/permease subunit
MAAFLQFARRFFRPIQDLSEKYNMLQGAMASSERIFNLLDTPPAETGSAPARLPEPGHGGIEFRNVWFAYQRRTDGDDEWDWVLRDVSFSVRPGERVAIVGHTGAGKTSLISLLLRFYEPQRGEILFDGVPIRDVPVEQLRQRIGLVLQDVFLFSRNIGHNVRLGRADINDERVAEAARRVGADAFIRRLPAGYAEQLGERGTSLSTGERQLLSFARALAFDPQVLILDEATSSVDSALEERIEDALRTLMHGRTSLIIAHRLSTVQSTDRIIVLHHGVLREEGTHETLLRAGGLYARLYELQFERMLPAGADRTPVSGARPSATVSPGAGSRGNATMPAREAS